MSHFTTLKELMRPVNLMGVIMFASTIYGWNYNSFIVPYSQEDRCLHDHQWVQQGHWDPSNTKEIIRKKKFTS